jgi:hypothetical protein
MIATHTVPSLQGTLAKRTKPTLQPNFAKEPFRPSRSDAGLRDSANMIDKQIVDKNRQCLTAGHTQLPDPGVAKVGSFGYLSGNPTRKRLETATAHTGKRWRSLCVVLKNVYAIRCRYV